MSKHTPAPWQYCQSLSDPKKHSYAVLDETGTSLIADVYKKHKFIEWGHKDNGPDPETTEANARLIAAAPLMLQALETFIRRVNPGEIRNEKVSRYNVSDLDESIILSLNAIKAATE